VTDFAIRHLSVLSYAQGFTAWHYRHASLLADALRDGFFNSAGDMLASGDTIMISAQDGGVFVFVHRSTDAAGVVIEPMCRTTGQGGAS